MIQRYLWMILIFFNLFMDDQIAKALQMKI